MRSLRITSWLVALFALLSLSASAAEFTIRDGVVSGDFVLQNGNILRGELVDQNEDGIIVKRDVGGFSPRESWANLSQETLRALVKLGGPYAENAEPFVELSPEELKMHETKREVVVRDVPNRVERPTPKPGLFGGFASPIGLLMLLVLYAGNLYAAYEIAVYRQRSPVVVCVVSAILPVLGPLIFFGLPTAELSHEMTPEEAAVATAGAAARKTTGVVAPKASGLSLAAAGKAATPTAHTQPQIYQRGEHTFNRRFFESKFPGFFRVVLGEAEKDLVLIFRTVKNEYVGKRISRISMNELHLVLLSDGSEESISFGEIQTVIVKHKDAKL